MVQSLCQDVDYEVRGCMCRQLDPVARGLGYVYMYIWQKLAAFLHSWSDAGRVVFLVFCFSVFGTMY